MIKLLYITNGITGSGGLERVLSAKASLLAENYGYEIHILSLNEKEKKAFFQFSDKIKFYSVAVSGNPFQYFIQYKNGIQNIVDEVKPDVISVCDDALKGFFLPKLIKTKAKWIHESHASFLLGDRGKGISFLKKVEHQFKQLLGKNFSKVILLTEAHKKEWNLSHLIVIPNPLSFKTEKTALLQNKKIIAVGSYSYNKGYDLLLKIWQKTEETLHDWELDIYGKGTQENLQPIIETLQLKNVKCHQAVSDISQKYLESSVFVLSSRSEGFGMVLIEAMSCGLPLISFDCPNGPKDIISDGEDGFLIENGNIDAFTAKLKLLMEDQVLRQQFGNKGLQNSKRYEPNKIVAQWDQLFKNLTS